MFPKVVNISTDKVKNKVVSNRHKMLQNVAKCCKTSQNVAKFAKCCKTSQNVAKRRKTMQAKYVKGHKNFLFAVL